MAICTVQVTNISPKATSQQMKELFSYFGDIDELKVYPEDEYRSNIPSKVCFVTFKERSSLETALHISNTAFIDRPLIVAQSGFEVIPEESIAMGLATPAVAANSQESAAILPTINAAAAAITAAVTGMSSPTNNTPLLPTPNNAQQPSSQPQQQQSSLLGTPGPLIQNAVAGALQQAQNVASSINANMDNSSSSLISMAGTVIPSTPVITGNVDPTKIDEIRRTIYVGNLTSDLTADQIMNFFQTCGEIRYVRMAGDETQPTRFAFVEFTNPESVQISLQYNGAMFGDRPIKVNHSKNAIVKPQGKTPEMAQKEVDEAMRKVRQATQIITTEIVPEDKKSRSRSRTRSRERKRSRDRGTRRRSRSAERRRSYSRSPRRHRHRSYSRSPRRRDSRDYRRVSNRYSYRSRSPPRRHYYGGSGGYRRRSPDRDRYRSPERDRYRSPERDRYRKRSRSRSKSRSGSPRRKSWKDSGHKRDKGKRREKDRDISASPSPERKKSKKSKKEKKHRRKTPSISPSLSPSPEPEADESIAANDPSDASDADEQHSFDGHASSNSED